MQLAAIYALLCMTFLVMGALYWMIEKLFSRVEKIEEWQLKHDPYGEDY